MALYLLCLKGTGNGCDYTIGCNEKCISIKAKTWEDAEDKAAERIYEHSSGDNPITRATMYEVGEARSLQPAVLARRHEKRQDEKQRKSDMAELQKLAARLNVQLPGGL